MLGIYGRPGAVGIRRRRKEAGVGWDELALALGAKPAKKAKPSYQVGDKTGPCKAYCAPLASCCLSAADSADYGTRLYGCVPTAGDDYILPLCLHMCLCPQQGCDPCPRTRSRDQLSSAWLGNLAANLCGMCLQNGPSELFLCAPLGIFEPRHRLSAVLVPVCGSLPSGLGFAASAPCASQLRLLLEMDLLQMEAQLQLWV